MTQQDYYRNLAIERLNTELKKISPEFAEQFFENAGSTTEELRYMNVPRTSMARVERAIAFAHWIYGEGQGDSEYDNWQESVQYLASISKIQDTVKLFSSPITSSNKNIEVVKSIPKEDAIKLIEKAQRFIKGPEAHERLKALAVSSDASPIRKDFLKDEETLERIKQADSPFLASSIVVSSFDDVTFSRIMMLWDELIEIAQESQVQEVYSLVEGLSSGYILQYLFDFDRTDEEILNAWRILLSFNEQLSWKQAMHVIDFPDDCEGLPIEWLNAIVSNTTPDSYNEKKASGVILKPGVLGVSLRQKENGTRLIIRETPKQVSCLSLTLDPSVGCYVLTKDNSLETDSFEIHSFIPVSGDYRMPRTQSELKKD